MIVAGAFFPVISCLLLLIVLIGFGPTLYLRAWFEVPKVPAFLIIHGLVLTAWFALLVAQSALVRTKRVSTHRTLGAVALGVGALVVVSTLGANLAFTARVVQRLNETPLPALKGIAALIWGNYALIVSFVAFVTTAILLRRRPEV